MQTWDIRVSGEAGGAFTQAGACLKPNNTTLDPDLRALSAWLAVCCAATPGAVASSAESRAPLFFSWGWYTENESPQLQQIMGGEVSHC